MASNNSGFGPPSRPRDASHSRRLGMYTQPGVSRPERREADIAHISGQVENRRAALPVSHGRPTGLPRPSQRAPSPSMVLRSMPEPQPVVVSPSRFGFGKPARKNTSEGESVAQAAVPELKPKSSRNVLRRKPSSISVYSGSIRPTVAASAPPLPTSSQTQKSSDYPSTEASLKSREAFQEVFGGRSTPTSAVPSPRIYPELDRYGARPEVSAISDTRFVPELPHKLSTQDLPPPTPLFSGGPSTSSISGGGGGGGGAGHNRYSSGYSVSGYSASPSTRFSESPGPGGMYSRDTTPTSISSQSPGLIAFAKPTTPRLRQGSPAQSRPPVTRRRTGSISNEAEIPGPLIDPQGLPSLRESLNSSSSNSTVKGGGGGGDKGDKDVKGKKKKRLSPLPPSPPPRKSSQKFKKSPESEKSSSKSPQASARPGMMSPQDESPTRQRPAIPHAQAKATPPLRPSREGAPDLLEQFEEPATVIQSNLTGINVSQERRRSLLPKVPVSSPPLPTTTSQPQQPSRVPLHAASPLPLQPQKEIAQPPTGLGIVPDLRPAQLPPTACRSPALRTPSPSIANTKPRFGLFRRAKTTPEVPQVENKERPLRKGPAAGTGHEGYGKYAMRGRSNSAGSAGWTRDRSFSATSSSNDNPPHDPFFLQRMSPVIIAGGGEIIENRNTSTELPRTESNQSISQLGRPSTDSKTSSKSNLGPEAGPRTTLWPSALPKDKEASKRSSTLAVPRYRRPSDSSDDGFAQNPSRMLRRSIQRLNASATALNLPKTIVGGGPSSSVSSFDGSVFSNESKMDPKAEVLRGRTAATGPKKLSKRAKSPRKWNFFSRSQTAQKSKTEAASMTVVVEKPAVKTVPHYAMLDSSDEQQDLDAMDLEDILHDADVISLSNEELDMLQFGYVRKSTEQEQSIDAVSSPQEQVSLQEPIIFTSPEPITPEIPQTELHVTQETAPVRPSRLPQVGRIPKVISARPLATSPKSFSRPFARLSVVQPLPEPIKVDEQSIALGPSPPKPSTPEPGTVVQDSQIVDDANKAHSRHLSGDSKSESTRGSRLEFLAFSPRKSSEATTSSSGNMSFAGTTAVIPEKDAALGEDEVWDEYDDLIENDNGDDSTMKVPPSATSSHGQPFQFENYESRAVKRSQRLPKESPTIAQIPAPLDLRTPLKPGTSTTSLRGSNFGRKIREALATTPTTPMSFTDFFSSYGDRNNSVSSEAQLPRRPRSRSSSRMSVSTNHSLEPGIERDPELHLDQESDSPISQVNLRVGSMTVSKWLTFGHVLFSPAREQLMQLDEPTKTHSILVIDGLGNDDWSFYAAETYPTATFYNLSPTRPVPPNQSSPSSFPLTPPNHRQVQYMSQLDKFPFPPAYFDVVAIRFPVAMSETAYRNLISEAKRVLKSDGYLEMAILDLDLMNMGNRARRAIRGLKVRIQAANSTISLGSASDTMMRIVGKKGFIDIKTCKVGVPVASIVSRASSAQDPESTSQSEDKGKQKEEPSLVDMMKDESSAGDEGIMKMVSKVGRWWYTKCYEMAAMDPSRAAAVDLGGSGGSGSASIFSDPALLSECEKWNSSFKLVVAHAQKPVTSRRRTLSV